METDWDLIFDGLLIAGLGYVVVLMALAGLYFAFRYLPDLLHLQIRSRLRREGRAVEAREELSIVGDVGAAIATALYLYFNEQHDEENTIITIKKVSKTYSPWSSKIFGISNHRQKARL